MPYVTSPHDGAQLYYVDYRPATSPPPFKPAAERENNLKHNTSLFFLHGWPMSSRMYEHLMLEFSEGYGVRSIASDRRGFGKSDWSGPNPAGDVSYEVLARDTLAILRSIPDLGPFIFVASSMACGESVLVYEFMKEAGIADQCKGFVWLGPSMPYPIQTKSNPTAPPRELWDSILQGLRNDRVGFVKASIGGVFGTPSGIEMSDTALEFFVNIVYEADAIAMERCPQIFVTYDFTEKLKLLQHEKILILHGDKDQGMPVEASSKIIDTLVPTASLKVYEMAAHGLYYTHAAQVVDDILTMLKEVS